MRLSRLGPFSLYSLALNIQDAPRQKLRNGLEIGRVALAILLTPWDRLPFGIVRCSIWGFSEPVVHVFLVELVFMPIVDMGRVSVGRRVIGKGAVTDRPASKP